MKMQLSFGFLCFVLVGVMAAATAAFHVDMDSMYGQQLADQYALGLRQHLTADYLDALQQQEQLDGADEDEDKDGDGGGKEKGKGKGKRKGKGKGKGRGKGKGKGKGKEGEGGEGDGDAAGAFESLFD